MQTIFVCGGRGTRLGPQLTGPKSLMQVGGAPLLEQLIGHISVFHRSAAQPVVIIDASDRETPKALSRLLPAARIVRQNRPDGVANALLLALPFLDDVVVATLGDVFIDGTLPPLPCEPALAFWRDAPVAETVKNFGISTNAEGLVSAVIEKPTDGRGLMCGMGVYVLTRSIISRFPDAPVDTRTGERGITAAIEAAIASGVAFRAVPFAGYYNNINSSTDLAAVERRVAHAIWRA